MGIQTAYTHKLIARKRPTLQIKILHKIANEGRQSKSTLKKEWNRSYSIISEAIDALKKKGILQRLKPQKRIHGRPEIFYFLTEKGINTLIDLEIPLDEFWRMIFFAFDKNTKHNLTCNIDDIFSYYEKNVLQYSREYTPLHNVFPDNIEFHFKEYCDSDNDIVETIRILGSDGPLSYEQLSKKLQEREYSINGIIDLKKRIFYNFVILEKGNKYELSIPGILLLLQLIYEEFRTGSTDASKTCLTTLEKLVRNYERKLPLIFGKWSYLANQCNSIEILESFIPCFSTKRYGSIQTNSIQELLDAQETIGIMYGMKVSEEFLAGRKAWHKWLSMNEERSTPLEKSPVSGPLKHILELGVLDWEYNPESIRRLKLPTKFSGKERIEFIEKYEQNIMSFRFYTCLLGKKYGFNPSKWASFLEKDPELKKWYNGWIKEIVRFENNNIEKLEHLKKQLTE